jgi:dTMP kinase
MQLFSRKGLFVSIEGIDGAGKSTLVPLLTQRLQKDISLITTSFEPGGTDYGQKIRGLLFDVKQAGVKNLHPSASGALYLSDHIHHQASKILPALNEGHLVIQDRSFMDSQRAYFPEGESDPCYLAHNILHVDCLMPDKTFLLHVPPEVALERATARGDEKFKAKPWSNLESMRLISQRYLTYASKEPDRFLVYKLDGTESPEAVAQTVSAHILAAYFHKTALPFEHD